LNVIFFPINFCLFPFEKKLIYSVYALYLLLFSLPVIALANSAAFKNTEKFKIYQYNLKNWLRLQTLLMFSFGEKFSYIRLSSYSDLKTISYTVQYRVLYFWTVDEIVPWIKIPSHFSQRKYFKFKS
jgi:hypothetical protein